VEPDYDVWKEYAYKVGMHPAVTTYLDIKKHNFYKVQSSVDGKKFVTARGWEDLSQMIRLYEKNGLPVDVNLVSQYLQDKEIARDFAVYYDLFLKYRSDYQVDKILEGKEDESIRSRAKRAKFDERLSLLGLLLDGVGGYLKDVMEYDGMLGDYMNTLKLYRMECMKSKTTPKAAMESLLAKQDTELEQGIKAGSLSSDGQKRKRKLIEKLRTLFPALAECSDGASAFKAAKTDFDLTVKDLKKQAADAGKKLSYVFTFCEGAFGDGQEMLILVTELTISYYGAGFISRYGCKEYFNHNKDLLFYERQKELITQLDQYLLEE